MCVSEPGEAVEQLGGGAGSETARVPVRGGRVDAPVGRAQRTACYSPAAKCRTRQIARQPALLPGMGCSCAPLCLL